MQRGESGGHGIGGNRRSRGWRRRMLAGLVAVVIQAGLLGLALLIGVLDPKPPQEGRLKVAPSTGARERKQAQAVNQQLAKVERYEKAGRQQMMDQFLDSTRPQVSLPQPDLARSVQAMGSVLPVNSFFEGAMSGLEAAMGDTQLPPPDPVTFMGESLNATRIVLLLDVSASVKTKIERAGLSMEALREEVHKFVDQLGPNHLFGVIQFTRKWQAFRGELVPATASIKAEAKAWINGSFQTTGTSGRNWSGGYPNGIEAVLSTAFAMDPQLDEVFVVSDGDFQRTPPGGGGQDVPWAVLRAFTRDLQSESISSTRLRVLCFFPPAEALPDLKAWTHENGPGSLRIIGQNPVLSR